MGKKINALEMWIYRRMLRIPWTACKANKEVLRMMYTKLSLLVTAKQRKAAFFGHIMRKNGLQRLLLEGKLNGKRGRGRPRLLWMENIKEWMKLSYVECVRKADNRKQWRSMIVDLLRADDTS